MKISEVLNKRNYEPISCTRICKVYSAKLIDDNGIQYQFKSARSRIYFERRCDLMNALNHAFGVECCIHWQKKYGDSVIIEERYITI
jgi:hypothetical protein